MPRLLKFGLPLIVGLLILPVSGFFSEPAKPGQGVAPTLAELQRQIPLHPALANLPEIGAFEWKGPYQREGVYRNLYVVYGKAADPQAILDWSEWPHQPEQTESTKPDEVTSLGYFTTIDYAAEAFSDGKFKIFFWTPVY